MGDEDLDVEATEPSEAQEPVELVFKFSQHHYVYPFAVVYELGLQALEAGAIPQFDSEQRTAIAYINRHALERLADATPPKKGREFSNHGRSAYHPADREEYENAIQVELVKPDRKEEADG